MYLWGYEMSDTFDYDKLADAMSKRSVGFDPANFDLFVKNMKDVTESMKKAQPVYKTMQGLMSGQVAQLRDIEKELEALDTAINEAVDATSTGADNAKKAAAIAAKQELLAGQRAQALRVSFHNLGVTTLSVADSMVKGAFDFVQGLQGSGDGVDIGAQLAKNAMKSTGETLTSLVNVVGVASTAFMTMAGPIGWVAKGFMILAPLLGAMIKKSAEFGEKAVDTLTTEIKNTEKAFKTVNSAGATLGGGMTELRGYAAESGMGLEGFANAVKASTTDLRATGMGMGEAAKKLSGISKELRGSQLGMQLRSLGYSIEEQAELGAQVAANLTVSGRLRSMSDKEIAGVTAQYGKDLKVLAGITGEDAKKAMEKARMQSMEADLLAEAFQTGGAPAVEKLQAQLAATPDALKKGFMEFVSTGGQAVTDAATNVAMTQNPKIKEMYEQQYATLKDGTKSASDAMDETGKLTERVGKYALDHMENTRILSQASRLGADSITKFAEVTNSLVRIGYERQPGATDKTRTAVNQGAVNASPFDKSVNELNEGTQKLKAQLVTELTPATIIFAESLRKGIKTVDSALEEMGVKEKRNSIEKLEDKSIQTLAKPGNSAGENVGAAMSGGAFNIVGFSDGGISSGSAAGHVEMLHGTELVVPLTAQGVIKEGTKGFESLLGLVGAMAAESPPSPAVNAPAASTTQAGNQIDLGELVQSLKDILATANDQLEKQDEMLRAMQDTKDYTQRLFDVMA